MKVLDLEFTNSQLFSKGTVVTLGNFDGLHKAHLILIQRLNEKKTQFQLPSVLITYHPNPSIVLGKNKYLKNIYSQEKKQEILSKMGIDFYLNIPFTYEFSQINAFNFIKDILVEKLNVKYIVIGYNHYFGKDREGDYEYLVKFSNQFGYIVEEIPPIYLGNEKISSSTIRFLLQNGEIEQANAMLGRPFSLSGLVVKGEGRGRTIHFPTANISILEDILQPAQGVYIGATKLNNVFYKSIINIGCKPTFEGKTLTIESHLLEFQGDLYEKYVELFFLKRIREEKKFQSVEELVKQLYVDREIAIKFFETTDLTFF